MKHLDLQGTNAHWVAEVKQRKGKYGIMWKYGGQSHLHCPLMLARALGEQLRLRAQTENAKARGCATNAALPPSGDDAQGTAQPARADTAGMDPDDAAPAPGSDAANGHDEEEEEAADAEGGGRSKPGPRPEAPEAKQLDDSLDLKSTFNILVTSAYEARVRVGWLEDNLQTERATAARLDQELRAAQKRTAAAEDRAKAAELRLEQEREKNQRLCSILKQMHA